MVMLCIQQEDVLQWIFLHKKLCYEKSGPWHQARGKLQEARFQRQHDREIDETTLSLYQLRADKSGAGPANNHHLLCHDW